jgi:hypothetical protein
MPDANTLAAPLATSREGGSNMTSDPALTQEAVARLKAGEPAEQVVLALVTRGMAEPDARAVVGHLLELKREADQMAASARVDQQIQTALGQAARADNANKATWSLAGGIVFALAGLGGIAMGWLAISAAKNDPMPMLHAQQIESMTKTGALMLSLGVGALLAGALLVVIGVARARKK